MSWYFEEARDAIIKMYRESLKVKKENPANSCQKNGSSSDEANEIIESLGLKEEKEIDISRFKIEDVVWKRLLKRLWSVILLDT